MLHHTALAGVVGFVLAITPAHADQTTVKPRVASDACANIGMVWWNELLSTETEKLSNFYARVLGWSKSVVDVELQKPPATSSEDKYMLFSKGAREAAGLMKYRHPEAPATSVGWFVYIQVARVEDAAAQVIANGGSIVHPPAEMPDGNTIAVVRDPMGNIFGLVTPVDAKNC